MGEQSRSSGSRGGGLPLVLALLGGVLVIAGVAVLADNYGADYDCAHELRCHNEGSRTPSAADRATAASGFGLEHPRANGDPLPGPQGSMLVAGGLALWLGALCLRPRRRRDDRDVDRSALHPLSPEQQLAQYERLRARGTLSDEEFEDRRARLVGVRGAAPDGERPG